jgi:serine/threonine protein kinase
VKEASGGLTAAMMKPKPGEIQQHFPEVILLVGKGLPSELAQLWRPSRSIGSFDKKELVAKDTRHRIFRVRDGETWFAIKEYHIEQAGDLRTCFKEAGIIYRHRHLNIVEIKALFLVTGDTGNTFFYMQMPWYTNRSVDKWVCGDQRPGWVKVRSVLLDALIGLAHLHESGILHGDVKPPNILVDDRERGRLADFDISIDTKERTSARAIMTMTMRATALGMTIDFAAPELKTSNQATKHTDMFAYGKTVQCLQVHCEPGAQEAFHDNARGQTAALVKDLTLDDPKSRPAAKHVIERSPFFTISTRSPFIRPSQLA